MKHDHKFKLFRFFIDYIIKVCSCKFGLAKFSITLFMNAVGRGNILFNVYLYTGIILLCISGHEELLTKAKLAAHFPACAVLLKTFGALFHAFTKKRSYLYVLCSLYEDKIDKDRRTYRNVNFEMECDVV
jgi:hypothetical protein